MMETATVTKRCTACGEDKDPAAFSAGKGQCKPCRADVYRERYRQDHPDWVRPIPADATTRTCSQCQEQKPATTEFFSPERRVGDGLAASCRACTKAARDPAVNLARVQRWYAENIPVARARSRRWYDANRLEKAQADHVRYRSQRQWRLDRARITGPLWRARNPDSSRLIEQRRRARKAAVVNTLTAAEWTAILEYFGHRCAYCLQPASKLTIDHIRPIAMGGPHSADNVVPACVACNSSKGAKTLLEFLR